MSKSKNKKKNKTIAKTSDGDMIKNFVDICKMSQDDLKTFVARELAKTHKASVIGDGYVFASGDFPVLLVAHLDTVHKDLPSEIYYEPIRDELYSTQGIGGDDRCGVYMILEIIKKYNCSVLFCEDEEIGGIGADKFTKDYADTDVKFNYMIELDRRGSNDAVFYDCANDEFEKFITKEFFKTAYGSFSDISILAPCFGCSAVNLSCGYYNAHQKSEYVRIGEMNRVIKEVCSLIERTQKDVVFEYVDGYQGLYDDSWYRGYCDGYGNYYGKSVGKTYGKTPIEYCEMGYMICWVEDGKDQCEEYIACSEEEVVGTFLMTHPSICYKDIEVYEMY